MHARVYRASHGAACRAEHGSAAVSPGACACRPEDPDDVEILTRGLRKQDSMEYTRARLAQSRARSGSMGPPQHELRSIEAHDGVDAVVVQNIELSAKALLKGLVRSLPQEVVQEVEVVSAKFSLDSKQLTVLKRGWFSGRSIYFE